LLHGRQHASDDVIQSVKDFIQALGEFLYQSGIHKPCRKDGITAMKVHVDCAEK